MDFSEISLMAMQFLLPLFVAALTWAAAKLASYIKSKVNNEYLRGMLIRLDEAVVTAVKDLQQTVVDKIKQANADGKITDAEKKEIKDAALDNVKSHLGAKGLKVLAKVLGLSGGDINGFLSAKIESAVHDIKVTDRAVSNAIAGEVKELNPLA